MTPLLDTLVGGPDQTIARPAIARARVVRVPASLADSLTVALINFSPNYEYEVPAGNWVLRGTALPVVGDSCVVVFDDNGDAWVAGWTGASAFTAVGDAGGDLNGTYPNPEVNAILGMGASHLNPWPNDGLISDDFLVPGHSNSALVDYRPGHIRWIRSSLAGGGTGNKRLTLFWLNRESINWQEGGPVIVEVFQVYPHGGAYTKSIISGGYGYPLTIDVVEVAGSSTAGRYVPLMTTETIYSGAFSEAQFYLDIVDYDQVLVKVTHYGRKEVNRPFTATGQIDFDVAFTVAGSAGSNIGTTGYITAEDVKPDAVGHYNVKRFGAAGDGSADDTSEIQAVINAVEAAGGGVVYFPPGTYKITGGGLVVDDENVTLRGAGSHQSVLLAGGTTNDSALLTLTSAHTVVEDLGFDGADSTYTLYGVKIEESSIDKWHRVERCHFEDFSNASDEAYGIWSWVSFYVKVIDNTFEDCRRPIYLAEPDKGVEVAGNVLTSSRNLTQDGIYLTKWEAGDSDAYVHGNSVRDVQVDPSGVGSNGHAIQVYNCRNTRITDNFCTDCLCSGVHFGSGTQGGSIKGNKITSCGYGIFVECNIDTSDVTVGSAGGLRGCEVIGNYVRGTSFPTLAWTAGGINVSYSAGSTIANNIVHDGDGEGIFTDSDRVTVNGNVVYNNWKVDSPTGSLLYKGGIRCYGSHCSFTGNVCFDNQASKTQTYGIAVTDSVHTMVTNQLTGNGTAGFYEESGGGSNLKTANAV